MSLINILIVEDEVIVADDVRVTLEEFGYNVVGIAASGEEAIACSDSRRPDLVLMDITLKGDIDGIAAARQIKQDLNIPVVFLTAHGEESTVTRARRAGPSGYLIKPFTDHDLRAAIEEALDGGAVS